MDKELFKKIVTPQLESFSAKSPEDAADIICSAYDKALKSKAFSGSGQNFLTANLKSLKDAFTNGFKLNKQAAQLQNNSNVSSENAIKTRYQEGKHGIIKFSDTYKDGPIVFVIGGTQIKDEKGQDWYPGIRNSNHNEGYMWEQGFNNLNNFHVYNCKTSYDATRGWKECLQILNSKSIKITKKIIVGFSLGARTMHGVFKLEPASNWSTIHIIGPSMPRSGDATEHVDMINSLKDKSKVFYFQRDGLDKATEGATVANKKAIGNLFLALPNNVINTTSHNPDGPFKSSSWIRKNVILTKSKSENPLSKPKTHSSDDAGWNVMTVGLTKYWLSATFNLIPPSPPAASTTNILVSFPGNIEKLPKKLKLAFNEAFSEKTPKAVEAIANTLIEYQSTISGMYTGLTPNGSPVIKKWRGVFGDNPNKKESRKNNNIIPLVKTTSFKQLNDGAGFQLKTKRGRFGEYVARIDTNGNEVIPAAANDLQSTQKNGRLNLNLLVMVDDGNAILEKNCANAYIKMQQDAKLQGVELKLKSTKASSGYRSLGRPGDLKFRENKSVKHRTQYAAREDYDLCVRQKGVGGCGRRRAAPVWPDRGGSNHGWGRAIDIGPRDVQDWIRLNGWKYGWYWGEAPSEEWHFTWVLSAGIDQTLGPGKFYLYDEKGNINPSDY